MMLYKGEAADDVGVRICFELVRGCRSCGIIVGMTEGQIRRVCGKSIGWGCGRDVLGRDKGITDGDGRGGWLGAWNGCRHRVGGLGAVVGVAVGMQQSCWEGRGARGLQLLATTVSP